MRQPPPRSVMERPVICRRCRTVTMAQSDGTNVTMCGCGAPILPINDMLMSLIAEGGETSQETHDQAGRMMMCP